MNEGAATPAAGTNESATVVEDDSDDEVEQDE